MSDWAFTTPSLGYPELDEFVLADGTDYIKGPSLGSTARAAHPTYGEGEFIWLLGVASTVVGSLVTYNATTYQTALSPNTANFSAPVAVAMAATLALYRGWYQIGGNAVIKKTNVQVLPQAKVYQSGTAGRIFVTSTAGKQILGARAANLTTVTTTTSTLVVTIDRPHFQGQIV